MTAYQHTINKECLFEGKGLHTGVISKLKVLPAQPGTGIVFYRTDVSPQVSIEAIATNVSHTARNTTITKGEVCILTIEHLMSAFAGLGIDNAKVEINGPEMPILDGSARPYVEAFKAVGLCAQEVPVKVLNIDKTIEIKDEESGSWVKIEPADAPSFDVTVDFNSRVLGVQTAHYDEQVDYAAEIAVCRTFCFFHEIEFLFSKNLIKGGDVDNAIVVVEHPVSDEQVQAIAERIGRATLKVNGGYLSNLTLHFPNECGRHKLLDLMGDMRLTGYVLNAHVTAYKPGHSINTKAAKAVLEYAETIK